MMMNGYARNNSSDNFVIVVFCVYVGWRGVGFELHYESDALCILPIMKIKLSFICKQN